MRPFCILLVLLALGVAMPPVDDGRSPSPLPAAAQSAPPGVPPPPGLVSDDLISTPPERPASLSPLASGALRQAIDRVARGQAPDDVDLVAGRLRVELLHSLSASDAAIAVAALGGSAEGQSPGLTQALVPPGRLAALQAVSGIDFIRPPIEANFPQSGGPAAPLRPPLGVTITGEEVAKMNADDWHAAGLTGAGVKVGIVDVFDGAIWDASEAAGEVPVPAGTFCSINGAACDLFTAAPGVNHGVGVAEIVHEMAPAAAIYLATVLTLTDLQAAEDYFDTQGVHVISRSLTSKYDGSGDGTGPIASIINDAVADGIAWINAAGNLASDGSTPGKYWRGAWSDPDGDNILNFTPTDEFLGFSCPYNLGLRWNDWGLDRTDYDVYIYDNPTDAEPFASSVDNQPGGAPPLELNIPCTGDVDYLVIELFDPGGGTAGDVLEFATNNGFLEHWQNAYSASSPAVDTASPGAIGVGAIDPPTGVTIARYSSQGPTNDARAKPDLVTPACVLNLAFSPACFNGTSAAAPSAAGALALVIGAGLAPTPAAAKSYLLASTVDRGAAGIDNVFGYGELILGTPPVDADSDGVFDGDDNCPAVPNADQANLDAANTAANRPGADALGDACDDDVDGDGYTGAAELALVPSGNPLLFCPIMRADTGGDGSVSILDISQVAGKFTQSIPPAPARYAQDADAVISILDLSRMAAEFLKNVSACP